MADKTSISEITTTGGYTDVVTGAAGGSKLTGQITMKATGNTTAGKVKLWLYDGTNRRLLTEILVPDHSTVSNTIPSWSATYTDPSIILASASWKIQAEITVNNTIHFTARYKDL